jgi:Chorismate mutase type I
VARNDAVEILAATDELLRTLIEANELQPDDIVSGLFTVTSDLDAAFPARAAEEFGWNIVALLHATEIPDRFRSASGFWCTLTPPGAGRKSSTAIFAEPACSAPTGRDPGQGYSARRRALGAGPPLDLPQ